MYYIYKSFITLQPHFFVFLPYRFNPFLFLYKPLIIVFTVDILVLGGFGVTEYGAKVLIAATLCEVVPNDGGATAKNSTCWNVVEQKLRHRNNILSPTCVERTTCSRLYEFLLQILLRTLPYFLQERN
jgi:hypothetical protein